MIKNLFTGELLKNFIIRDIYLDFLGTNHDIDYFKLKNHQALTGL